MSSKLGEPFESWGEERFGKPVSEVGSAEVRALPRIGGLRRLPAELTGQPEPPPDIEMLKRMGQASLFIKNTDGSEQAR